MKLLHGDRELDSECHLSGGPRQFRILLHYKGFGKNPEYPQAQALILRRIGVLNGVLTAVWLQKSGKRETPLSKKERMVPLGKSIPLQSADQIELIKKIRKSVSGLARLDEAEGPGNPEKSIYIQFTLPQPMTLAVLRTHLREESLEAEKAIRDINDTYQEFDGAAADVWIKRLQGVLSKYDDIAPKAKRRLSNSIERGPVGKIMKMIVGHRCQIGDALTAPCETFVGEDGMPFFEAHHVVQVSTLEKGSLQARNVVILCPNHHRELHHGQTSVMSDDGNNFSFEVAHGAGKIAKPDIESLLSRLHGRHDGECADEVA